jgi:anti-sigma regulatory factor (Ser/Thr protein kinase)
VHGPRGDTTGDWAAPGSAPLGPVGRRLSLVAELGLPAGVDAPSRARSAIREALTDTTPPESIDDVLLVASELVTNGVVHAGLGEEDLIRLRLWAGGLIRVEVRDRGRGFDRSKWAVCAPPTIEARGLAVVARFSTSWGITEDDGVLAWAELQLPMQ